MRSVNKIKKHAPKLTSIGQILAIVGFCTVVLGCKNNESKKEKFTYKPIPVQIEVAQKEEVQAFRRISGDVIPWDVLPLSFKVGGRVTRIMFDEGDQIKKGQLVALVNQRDYRLTRDLAKAQVSALRPHLERAETLLGKAALPQAQLDEIKGKMDAAEILKEQAEVQLSYARLKAPVSGIVIKRMVAVGDLVGPSRPVVVLANLHTVKVILPSSQQDLPLFSKGMNVELVAPGIEKNLTGKVNRIGYTADEKTRTFSIVLEVENKNLSLRAGMIVEAKIPLERLLGIFVPLDVVSRDSGSLPHVLVVDPSGKQAERRNIHVGKLVAGRIQVLDGLKEGDRIITQGMAEHGNHIVVVNNQVARGKVDAQ